MFKFILGFAAVVGFSFQVMAVEVDIVEAAEPAEDSSQPWVISFDGKTEVNAAVVGKILACHKKFSEENKQQLNEMLVHQGGVEELKARHHDMQRTPASREQLTLSNRELNESFVKGTLKDCLSK